MTPAALTPVGHTSTTNTATATANQLISQAADEARQGIADGGMPFGALLVVDGDIVSRGHNRQIQEQRYLAHAETVCFESYFDNNDGPLPAGSILVATEAPCPMCAGAAVVAGVHTVFIGENAHYQGAGGYSGLHLRPAAVHAAHPIHPARPGCARVQHPLRGLRSGSVGQSVARGAGPKLNPQLDCHR